jgi:outer membrane immunogenic protein
VFTFPPGVPSEVEAGRAEKTNAGWFVGGGLQYALTNHWSIRADYKYADRGDVAFRDDFGEGGGAPAFQRAELTEHNATVAIIFGF